MAKSIENLHESASFQDYKVEPSDELVDFIEDHPASDYQQEKTRYTMAFYLQNMLIESPREVNLGEKWFEKPAVPLPDFISHSRANKAIERLDEFNLVNHYSGTSGEGVSIIEKGENFEEIPDDLPSARVNIDLVDPVIYNYNEGQSRDKTNRDTFNDDTYNELVDVHDIDTTSLRKEYVREVNRRLNILNAQYFDKIEVNYDGTLDAYLLGHNIFKRIYKQSANGRLYPVKPTGAVPYWKLSSSRRENLVINGKRTVEIDYVSLHPNILLHKLEYDDHDSDVYLHLMDKLGLPDYAREGFKLAFLIAMNAENKDVFQNAIEYEAQMEKEKSKRHGGTQVNAPIKILLNQGFDADVLEKECEEIQPELREKLYTGEGHVLMKEDSDLMMNVLTELYHESIPGLPVHDSAIVPEENKETVKNTMERVYEDKYGYPIEAELE